MAMHDGIIYYTINTTAVCIPDCQNGGICAKPNVCRCSPGWDGDRCQIGTYFVNNSK